MYASYLGELNIRALMIFAVPQMAALLIVSVGSVEVSMTGSLAIRYSSKFVFAVLFFTVITYPQDCGLLHYDLHLRRHERHAPGNFH